ncbi:MAG: hypothetical protein H0A75_05505 [Candidatus Methanofishera endochildressiae]|uniref:Uncharacterized protein n=1 Tax=Candidatus Methanofishera endochildressiae TaxID=2738884 RepID=A0A7Z0SDN0_9GAMM|nr:hypothetical protein [Candidatus Methanofishera endochildressiae]
MIVAPRDRAILHEKIAQRFKLMPIVCWVLLQKLRFCISAVILNGCKMPSVRAVGYFLRSYLAGEINLQEVQELGTSQPAASQKRQFTWLRREVDAETFTKNIIYLGYF